MQLIRHSSALLKGLVTVSVLGGLGSVSPFLMPTSSGPRVVYTMTTSSSATGEAIATIDGTQLSVAVKGGAPNSLYSVWVDFRSRATLTVTPDYPAGALARGVAPAFATTQGVTAGMGPDANSFFTDGNGDALFTVALDYELLTAGDSPVVHAGLAMQGANRIGGHWMRVHEFDNAASLQMTDPVTGLPLLRRATAQGLTIVRHPDTVTHGHTPGVGGVDHFSAFSGDFPTTL